MAAPRARARDFDQAAGGNRKAGAQRASRRTRAA